MAENVGQIEYDVKLDTSQFKREAGNVDRAAKDLGQSAKISFGEVAKGALAFVGVTSILEGLKRATIGSVMAFADFEQNLGLLRAVTGSTQAQLKSLKETSIALGNDLSLPGVSAADAAQAMTELGKAGLGVNDILKASKGVLQAAKAGNLDYATSATIVSNALLAFKLSGDQATKVADLFAAAANASSADIADVGMALQQTAAQAASLKVPLSDTVTVIAELANQGIRGSDAGTSLKTMLQRLSAPTDEAAGLMQELGIKVFDATGKFVGIRATVEQFTKATKNMTDEQKQAAYYQVFGADATRAANIVIGEGVEKFDQLSKAVNKQGAAADLAAAQNSGIKGTIDALKSSLETAQLKFGEYISKGLNPVLKKLTDQVPVISGSLLDVIQNFGTAFRSGGVVGVIDEIIKSFSSLNDRINFKAILSKVLESGLNAIKEFPWSKYTALITAGIITLFSSINYGELAAAAVVGLVTVIPQIISGFINGIFQAVTQHPLDVALLLLTLGFAPGRILGKLGEILSKIPLVGPLVKWIFDALVAAGNFITAPFKAFFSGLATSGLNALRAGFAPMVEAIKGILTSVLGAGGSFVGLFRGLGTRLGGSLGDGLSAIAGRLYGIGRDLVQRVVNAITGTSLYSSGRSLIQGFIDGIVSMVRNVANAAKGAMQSARNFFPFSPAKEGPFSGKGWTEYSGKALMEGMARGISSNLGIVNSALNAMSTPTLSPSMARVSGVDGIPSVGGSNVVNHIGTINISSDVDGERLLKRLGRDDEIASQGMVS